MARVRPLSLSFRQVRPASESPKLSSVFRSRYLRIVSGHRCSIDLCCDRFLTTSKIRLPPMVCRRSTFVHKLPCRRRVITNEEQIDHPIQIYIPDATIPGCWVTEFHLPHSWAWWEYNHLRFWFPDRTLEPSGWVEALIGDSLILTTTSRGFPPMGAR